MKKSGILCLLFMIALSACRDNIDDVTTTEEPYVPPIVNWTPQSRPVDGSVTGFVSDRAQDPIAGATVKMGNLTTTTDDYGHFFFNDVALDARGTYVTVEKQGFFEGSRRFFAVEDETNQVKIELMAKTFDQSFDAAAGGTVQISVGVSVIFPPNSIKHENGTAYTGEVKVATLWLDPSKPYTLDQMPGNLQGVDSEGEEVALGSYGMVAVELESDAGEPLNISEGNTATLTMPVPTSLQGSAPDEIPLWSFNEEHGIWVEESIATLNNGVYTGEVSHFSYWNCDYPFPLIEFTANLIDENGDPLYNYLVSITVNATGGGGSTGSGYTCPDGTISGLIPVNEDLTLKIYGICNELLHSENIGPFSDNVDLGTIAIDGSVLVQTTVTGELVDCDGVGITNGLVTFLFDGLTVYEYVSGGTFSTTFGTCANSTDVAVQGVDLDNSVQSGIKFITANGSQDVGLLEACNIQVDDFIEITVDDGNAPPITAIYKPSESYIDSLVTGGIGTSLYHYAITPTGNASNVHITFDGMTTGDYSSGNMVNFINDPDRGWQFEGEPFSTFTVTDYGNGGTPVVGTFEGTLTNYAVQPPASVTVTGKFNITN